LGAGIPVSTERGGVPTGEAEEAEEEKLLSDAIGVGGGNVRIVKNVIV